MKKISGAIVILLVLIQGAGCSVIIGKDDTVTQAGLSFRYVETLRNEASLRGAGFQEVVNSTDAATTLQRPNAVYADKFRVFVADTTPARVFVFDRNDKKVTVLGGDVKLIAPAGIVESAVGTIFVSDSQQGKIFGYDNNGKLVLNIGGTISPMSGSMVLLSRPSGMAYDVFRNRIYVADADAGHVQVISPLGDPLMVIGESGKKHEKTKHPQAVALDRSGNLFVLDSLKRTIQVFDPEGNFMHGFSLTGALPGSAINPLGIAVDSEGHLYVSDSVSNNIMLFDRDGVFLFTWGRTGSLHGEFWTPAGLFIDDRNLIYIADQTNGRIEVFQYEQ